MSGIPNTRMVSDGERAIVIIANIIGFIYNVPQVILTVRTKSANDLSFIFLSLRLVSAILWLTYTAMNWSADVFISWVITGASSGILFYYKLRYSEGSVWDECKWCRWCRRRGSQQREELRDEPAI